MKERVVCWCGFFRQSIACLSPGDGASCNKETRQLRSVGFLVSLPSSGCGDSEQALSYFVLRPAPTASPILGCRRFLWKCLSRNWEQTQEKSVCFTVGALLRNASFPFGELSKEDPAPRAAPRAEHSSRCHGASVGLCGGGSHLCPSSGQYLIPINLCDFIWSIND